MFVFPAIAFFDHINLIYGTISEFCTALDCPEMTGPGVRYDDLQYQPYITPLYPFSETSPCQNCLPFRITLTNSDLRLW